MALHKRLGDDTGQTSSEYAVVLAVITAGIVMTLTQAGAATQAAIERVVTLIP